MPKIGTVKRWDEERGFGFIGQEPAGSADIFVHRTALIGADMLNVGDKVQYEPDYDAKKQKHQAMTVTLIQTAAGVHWHNPHMNNMPMHAMPINHTMQGHPNMHGMPMGMNGGFMTPQGHPNQQINQGFMTPQGAPMTPPHQFGTPQTTPGPMAFW